MSIEALAMLGADYMDCGFELEAWERAGSPEEPPPAHLLPDQNQSLEVEKKRAYKHDKRLKAKMTQWIDVEASRNKSVFGFERGY